MNSFNEANRCLYILKDAVDKGAIQPVDNAGRRGDMEARRQKLPTALLPGQYFGTGGTGTDYEFCPQSPYQHVVPVTPQTLHSYPNGAQRASALHQTQHHKNKARKRQRLDSEIHWSPTKKEDLGRQDEATADVEYILAKHFRKLGFPVYNSAKEIIGFCRESNTEIGVGQFSPLSQHKNELGPNDVAEASCHLEEALSQNSQAVHCKKDWGSVRSMFNHAMVYDWSKDFGHA